MRFSRGMNFGLSNLYKENKFKDYKYFLLLTNDSEVESKNFLRNLISIMKRFKIPGTARISLAIYNTKEEIDVFISAIKKAKSMLS